MTSQTEPQTGSKRQLAERAIQLAMESRWDDAVQANAAIIAHYPADIEAHNRMGKALMELGRYREGRRAYRRALELDPGNTIAQKNLARLEGLVTAPPAKAEVQRPLSPEFFIAEMGKTGVSLLHDPNGDALSHVHAGDPVGLKAEGNRLQVLDADGEVLGEVEPKMALRLTRLMKGGNRYAAAVSALAEEGPRIIIRETFQDPSQAGKVSFPSPVGESVRPYMKESILRHETPEEPFEEDVEVEEWEGEGGARGRRIATLGYGAPTPLALGDEEEEGEEAEERADAEEEEEF